MTNVEIIRELHCYREMYNILQSTVTECIKGCKDLVVREKLIKVQQETEDIYTGEIYEYKDLNSDERVIIALLRLLMETEVEHATDPDMELVKSCVDWSLAIQNKKLDLTKEFIEEHTKRVLALMDEEDQAKQ